MSGTVAAPVLEISEAISETGGSNLPSVPLNLRVMAGDCILIDVRSALQGREFADMCCGLTPLRSGCVRFLGHDWADVPHELVSALRGHIGRLYGPESWIGFLPADVNVLLPQLYHTRRREAVLREMATGLSLAFGLPGLPINRLNALSPADVVRAACVRAFMGDPKLLFLDNPDLQRITDLVPAVLNALMAAHDQQAASIWLTRGDALWNDASFPANMRFRLAERGLVPMGTLA